MAIINSSNVKNKSKYDILKFFRHRLQVAANRDIPKEISINEEYLFDILEKQNWVCAISGKPMTMIKPGNRSARVKTNMSIDRINNNKGYVKGNVHIVQVVHNNRKRTMSLARYKRMWGLD